MLKISAFYLHKQKRFIPKKNMKSQSQILFHKNGSPLDLWILNDFSRHCTLAKQKLLSWITLKAHG